MWFKRVVNFFNPVKFSPGYYVQSCFLHIHLPCKQYTIFLEPSMVKYSSEKKNVFKLLFRSLRAISAHIRIAKNLVPKVTFSWGKLLFWKRWMQLFLFKIIKRGSGMHFWGLWTKIFICFVYKINVLCFDIN